MTASSFGCVPGLPILHSRDLVNWKIINYAIKQLPERFDTVQLGNGIWAPSIRYHDGWFWIFVGDPDLGIVMTRAKDPAGEWEPLHVVQEGKGLIDCCPLWDDDGKAWIVHAFANSRAGKKDIIVVKPMSPDGRRIIGDETLVIDGRNGVHPTIEGPKFYKRKGWYYIMAPAGGVKQGWQIAARAKSPTGPYEVKRVLEQGSTNINGPHQGGWVTTQRGEDWFMHFQDRGGYGRIVHLQPMRWVDDWPIIGEDRDGNGIGEPVLVHAKPNVGRTYPIATPQTSDTFDSPALGLQWQWMANPKPAYASLSDRPGWIRLSGIARVDGGKQLAGMPNQLLQKFPAPDFTATAKVEFKPGAEGSAGGLIVSGFSGLMITKTGEGLELQRITGVSTARSGASGGGNEQRPDRVEAAARVNDGPIWLRVRVTAPDSMCTFSYSTDGQHFAPLGSDFQAVFAGWMGAKMGLLCAGEGAQLDCDSFIVE
jgi:beta-xylosidase